MKGLSSIPCRWTRFNNIFFDSKCVKAFNKEKINIVGGRGVAASLVAGGRGFNPSAENYTQCIQD